MQTSNILIFTAHIQAASVITPKDILGYAVSVGLALLTAFLTYRFHLRKLKRETQEAIEKAKYEAILRAHERCFSLLAYLTETENGLSVIVWKKEKDTAEKSYIFNKQNCLLFLDELRKIYYEQGHGLYFSKEISAPLFECRSILYGLNLSVNSTGGEKIKNVQMVKRIYELCEIIREGIKSNIGLENKDLDFKKHK